MIDSARDLLDTELTALSGESYQRAYGAMVSVQMLAELEEVIQYKALPERRAPIRKMWWQRLQGCQRIVEDWQKIIQVHSLVVSPEEDMRTWLKYSSLCRKSGRLVTSPPFHPSNPFHPFLPFLPFLPFYPFHPYNSFYSFNFIMIIIIVQLLIDDYD